MINPHDCQRREMECSELSEAVAATRLAYYEALHLAQDGEDSTWAAAYEAETRYHEAKDAYKAARTALDADWQTWLDSLGIQYIAR